LVSFYNPSNASLVMLSFFQIMLPMLVAIIFFF
jgi:hypothetical protein